MRQKRLISSLIALSAGCAASAAQAAPTLRTQIDQRGDFLMFGNTSGFECANGVGVPAPDAATSVVDCPAGQGMGVTDTAPDTFWRADSPMVGQAEASDAFTAADARSTAMLVLPAGATITHARIYWAGLLTGNMMTDSSILIDRQGGALSQTVNADQAFYVNRNANSWYQSTADIKDLLVANGAGAYRVSGIGSMELGGGVNNDLLMAWVVVVFYSRPQDPPRNLALFDGLDLVPQGGMTQVTIDGFLVPNAGFDAKLGVIAYEGEQQYDGDALTFNGTALSNGANPDDNFFNSTRSRLGMAVSTAGDLPRLTGGPASMGGVDIDVVDVKAELDPGDTSATIVASSAMGGDTYTLGAFVTSIATFKPDFTTSGKTFTDVNGAPLLPGDVIEYTVTVTNTGNDASANTVLTDALPPGVTYVPGTISIGNTTFSDTAGNDQAEYTAGTRTITVRLGTGANGTQGGSLAIDQTVVVKFRVTVDANAAGSILNQAVVTAEGEQGAPEDEYPTDGNGNGNGVPPTEVIVDKCGDDDDCSGATPVCHTTPNPNVCVECVVDGDCMNPNAPDCLPNNTCGCTGNCTDTDGDGIPDDTEDTIGTDPLDADSDDDGVKDGAEPDPAGDSDGDGSIDALDPDSDNDNLFDGTEMGLPCDGEGTMANSPHCIADGDGGATKTDPRDDDSDDGGVKDGSEDVDHDGVKGDGETDPNDGSDDDDLDDTDGDGLTNGEEDAIGSDPTDADSDDDGVIDGDEANPSDNSDNDPLINVLDPDSDNDGLFDGTELGFDCEDDATDIAAGHCVADGDMGATVTSPIDRDTDHGGVSDGNEDVDLDGVIDPGETDPTLGHGGDDGTLDDDDEDGLSNGLEDSLGTDPDDADSDDDGVKDGDEPNFADDTDGEGGINALDPDSDGDGILDGTELGLDCSNPDTDPAPQNCVPDGDNGDTTTNSLDPDTDHGGVSDGEEDADRDGVIDDGERDPNDPSDDSEIPGEGGANAGGSAGNAGNAGNAGSVGGDGVMAGNNTGGASSGSGGVAGSATAGSGTAGNLGNNPNSDGVLEGGGCACRTTAPASSHAPLTALSLLGLLLARSARRRRQR